MFLPSAQPPLFAQLALPSLDMTADARVAQAAATQAAVLGVVEKQGFIKPLTNGEAVACRCLRACGLLDWDSHGLRYVPGKEWSE